MDIGELSRTFLVYRKTVYGLFGFNPVKSRVGAPVLSILRSSWNLLFSLLRSFNIIESCPKISSTVHLTLAALYVILVISIDLTGFGPTSKRMEEIMF